MKTGWRVCVLALLLAGGAAAAVPAQAKECREAAVTATSREYVSRSLGAFPGSWAAWREKVKSEIGDGWQAWRRAEDREIRCEQGAGASGGKRWTCTRSARPCRPGSGGGPGGTAGGSSGSGGGGSTPTGSEPKDDLPAIDQILRRGMKNAQVETLQYLLREAGYTLELDGDYGRATEDAVRDFQRKNKLKVDGRAGPETVEALTS
jgi:hypothetical protein